MPLSPLDWSGGPFLTLYAALLVAAALASIVAGVLLRPPGRDAPVNDPELLAVLAGGRRRLVDAAATGMLAGGTLAMTGKDRFLAPTGLERRWPELARHLAPRADAAERRLVGIGLLADADHSRVLRRAAVAPFLLLFLLGVAKLAVGIERGRPVGFLCLLLLLTLVVAALCWRHADRRTAAGLAALRRARAGHDRLRRAPMRDEMALGVALFGTAVLAGSQFTPFHRLRVGDGGGDVGGGDGGGADGGGGCGGGGCGGCGG